MKGAPVPQPRPRVTECPKGQTEGLPLVPSFPPMVLDGPPFQSAVYLGDTLRVIVYRLTFAMDKHVLESPEGDRVWEE